MAWNVVARYGTGLTHTYPAHSREGARTLKKRIERMAIRNSVPFDVRIKH